MPNNPACPPNPLPCGCRVVDFYEPDLTGLHMLRRHYVEFCALHAAAEDMLTALDKALANHGIQCDLADRMGYTAPTKASWVPFARAAVLKARPTKEKRAAEENKETK